MDYNSKAGIIVDFDNLDKDIKELINEAVSVRENAYTPYSKFKVGAALRCEDGSIAIGCNVENASFPAGICAERSAVARAVSDGMTKFTSISVAANSVNGILTSPCGVCRQTLAEFGDMPVYMSTPDMKKILKTSIKELLPGAFGLNGIISFQ